MQGQQQKFSDLDNAGSPLDMAVMERDRDTIAMVARALDVNDVALAFQPVVSSRAGNNVAYYEGLIRIFDETGRVIPARDFMGAVETRELGRRIDCAALGIGLKTLRANPSLRLAINMSARSIGYPHWMNILKKFIRLHPDVVERLILEITETSAMLVPEIVTIFMAEMQEKGITFALDDFGAGQTSFRHLKDFCFDILKIDGQFSRKVHSDPDNQVLTQALMSIARHFDMLAVAEAVETREEAQWLVNSGVDCLQGYYFAAPSLSAPWKVQEAQTLITG
ncbi:MULTISPECIES: EAL domain-containing protein [Paracoccaceae]|jgi:EAL domain-containing protein (putative c-di-GMP-specific phosphodiesterase class I)|uniref:EAL domain-containing protein n=1 Tax=Rhodobacterales TaxID=204455 RepID=UPI001B00F1C2|nr:EAL domain-containing protein [Boseongicola sp. H5]MBO6602734.1 EAL domain-containing protein [Roseicyclus sp.]MBO6623965.1 EAL domain-containing protein [Roseicyclus sp.]MBO6923026.1 EAL domain-containing protein [Roseicyclus sp.]